MKVAIVIMSCNNDIAELNTNAQKNTFISDLSEGNWNNEYSVYFYRGAKYDEKVGIYDEGKWKTVLCESDDRIVGTFEKTCEAYKCILEDSDFDIMVRCNISCYLNVKMLDVILSNDYDKSLILCNKIIGVFSEVPNYMNRLYPRGDFYIISKENVKNSLTMSEKYLNPNGDTLTLDRADDVLFGMCLSDSFETLSEYYDKLKMIGYAFIPRTEIDDKKVKSSLTSRVKTIPEGVKISGYGWESDCRKNDSEKMFKIHDILKNITYSNKIKVDNIIIPDKFIKDVIVHKAISEYTTLENIKKIKS